MAIHLLKDSCLRGLLTALCLVVVLSSAVSTVAVAAPPGAPQLFSGYVYPVVGPRLSSVFGDRKHPVKRVTKHHNGVDLAAPRRAAVRVIAEGRVVFADKYSGYGNLVVVSHPDGKTSHYGHLDEIKARPGAYLRPGQLIGYVGETGIATGPHLHFEIRKDGKPLDPEKYLPGLTETPEG